MITPPFLKKNSLVGLVSPAAGINASVIENAVTYLETRGFRTIVAPHAADVFRQFASTDKHRADDLQAMLNNSDVEAIWCTRGGYGAIRLLDMLNFSCLKKQPKWLIGFSDITALHAAFRREGIASIHGAMCKNLKDYDAAYCGMNALWQLLAGNVSEYKVPCHPFNRDGMAKGTLVGGNLTLLCALQGSEYDFDPTGKILFIEEVGEYLYRLDRMMQSLKVAGKLARLSGLIVGGMSDMFDNETPFAQSAYDVIADAVSSYSYPVLFDFPAGHLETNMPLMLGAEIRMEINGNNGSTISWLR
jgi:muramoyltetrapeptide carboxypeptidase